MFEMYEKIFTYKIMVNIAIYSPAVVYGCLTVCPYVYVCV